MKIHIIDGYGIAFRAFYAFPKVLNKYGLHIGGLIGFIKMMVNIVEKLNPTHLMIIFDKGKSFRSEIYSEYKANRKMLEPEIYDQLKALRNVVEKMMIKFDEMEGYEADDLIATYTDKFSQENIKSVIISCDKDLMQLINANTIIFDHIKSNYIEESDVIEKFGVCPKQFIEIQSLSGDASDNIPGVPSIGPKTAKKLIAIYGSIENIFCTIDSKDFADINIKPSVLKSLKENKNLAFLSKKLVTLDKNVPINFDMSDLDSIKILKPIRILADDSIKYLYTIGS